MKTVGRLHPDHLHDRARGLGTALSPDEWQRFGAHLATCPACAWERAATDDFAREREVHEMHETRSSLDLLIDGALAGALGDAPSIPSSSSASSASASTLAPRTKARSPRAFWASRASAASAASMAWVVAAALAAVAVPALYAMADLPSGPRAPSSDAPADRIADASLDAGANGTPSGGS